MAEWLYEAGIGECRAALVEEGCILAARIEREGEGPRVGAVLPARVGEKAGEVILERQGASGAHLAGGSSGLPTGAPLLVEVTRMALRERGRDKPVHVRPAAPGAVVDEGPDLRERLLAEGRAPVVDLYPHGADRLEIEGWSELLDAARTGCWDYAGVRLWIDATPAMTVIDVDGWDDLASLAPAASIAVSNALTCFDIGGPVVIDFPTLSNRELRQQVAELFDAHMPQPFERTSINGFGLMQVVRRRTRPSLIEQMQFYPLARDAGALLRQAERAKGTGALTLAARPELIDYIGACPHWIAALELGTGRAVRLRADPEIKGAGHAQ